MNIKDLKPVSSDNESVNTLYRNLNEFVKQLTNNPLLGGQYLKDVQLSSAPTLVNHSLGQTWQGYIITRQTGLVNIASERTIYDNKNIKLTADTGVTVDLWIF